ncbi:YraN family protein [Thermosyntropha sp.]|uniref:YraN family protein n=1 Tax=Thermosyntropha sp. TaxID=2740820 RepID=UPI0025E886D7|nr:YraN family protein [Thermosyntropha sp.]
MKRELGKLGENLAVEYLKKHGYKILGCNYYTRYGEIDIICAKKDVLIFVEVKTRRSLKYGEPEEAVTWRKINHIRRAAGIYLSQTDVFYKEIRFDVISILINEEGVSLSHIKEAF